MPNSSKETNKLIFDDILFNDFFDNFLEKQSYRELQNWIKLREKIEIPDSFQKTRKTVEKNKRSRLHDQLSKTKQLNNGQGIKGDFFHQLVFVSGNFSHIAFIPPYFDASSPEFSHPIETYRVIIELLLNLGMDPNTKDNFFAQTPLCAAIGFDNEPFALALLEFPEKVKLNAACNDTFSASTPLLLAIQRGNTKVAAKLIKLGADINKTDKFGMTPLHWAMIMGDKETMKLLLDREDVEIKQANNYKYPIDYLRIDPMDWEPLTREIDGKKIQVANSTKAPEFRPIQAHFWNKNDNFFRLRESLEKNIETCAQLLQSKQISVKQFC